MYRSLRHCRILLALLPLLVCATAASQGLRGEDYYRELKDSTDPIYRLDYDLAIERIFRLTKRYPEHPGPPLAHAAALWLRELFARQEIDLDRFIAPSYFTEPTDRKMPEEDQALFNRLVTRSQMLAQAILDEHPNDPDARYYLGAAEAILGAFALTIERKKLAALSHGKKAFEIQKAILGEHPDYYDSMMTVGAYEYLLANLPWYVKWLAVLTGHRGDQARGFDYLVQSAEKGSFVSNDARVLLMVLYVREREYDYALALARELHQRYPENFILHLNRAQILEKMGETDQALVVYREVVEQAERARPNYQKLSLPDLHYRLGSKLSALGQLEGALDEFQKAFAHPEASDERRALALLRAGETLDRLGRREDAIAAYRKVKTLANTNAYHALADRRIKKRFRP